MFMALIVQTSVLVGSAAWCAAAEEEQWKPWSSEGKPSYTIKRASTRPTLKGEWDGPVWKQANEAVVDKFLSIAVGSAGASPHRPETVARALYDDKGLYLCFRVKDRYVRSIETKYHGKVWEDACAEFFVQPKAERGYFNFEINCGGTMLLSYHENPDWKGETSRKGESVPLELAKTVEIFHSLPEKIEVELATDTDWTLEYFIPFALLEEYVGKLGNVSGQSWRANFYKCAENNSHPHWAAWSPILEGGSFHAPWYFGVVRFE